MDRRKLKRQILAPKKSAYNMVENELAILKKLDHPNCLKLYEIIDDPGW